MNFDRDKMLAALRDRYDKWAKEESEAIAKGCGMRGSHGDLCVYSIDDLFNEVMWKIMTQ